MNCTEAQRFLHAYLDNELDIAYSVEIERHLATCAACRESYDGYQALRAAIKGGPLYFTAPPQLRQRVSSSLHLRDRATFITRATLWRGLSVAAACLIVAALAVLLTGLWRGGPTTPPGGGGSALSQQVFDNHMRSLTANHLVDIRSSDPNTIKSWFQGKLNYTPYIYDISSDGYTLVGGRLDYLDRKNVAAIVYQYQGHIINFFLWPTTQGSAPIKMNTIQSTHLANWREEGMNCWVSSNASPDAIQKFVRLQQSWE
ncbi:anti-sigma factor family protein [Dictyobacter aurantiacus]|uniref:Membrane protein n=1 Tax=Dictyobacter aurantiacus TaxID=1936993 RepID=A0A401ZKT4_9CHLR|nr:anti-sigma factor [Dictyobacter aurantiacus]GCE07432.1 membrane protein [Dictyobacter aurantiacus]